MRTRRMLIKKFVTVNSMLLALTVILYAGEGNKTALPRTNLEVMKELAREITQEVIVQSHLAANDSMVLRFGPDENSAIIQDPVRETLSASGCVLFMKDDSVSGHRLTMDNNGTECRVSYGEMFREGFLGTKRLVRNIKIGRAHV